MDNRIFIIHGRNYKEMAEAVLQKAEVAAHIGAKDRRIGIKPNYLASLEPDMGATTHTALVEGVLSYLTKAGFQDITVMEGSWVGARTGEAFRELGVDSLCKKYGAKLADLQKDTAKTYDCQGMEIQICDTARNVDYMINMPVLKGHCQTIVTCALKNNKGVIPNSEKRRFHSLGLHKPIAHLNTVVRNDFILVDNICGDLDFEEGGNPVPMDRVLGFFDPVLCDAFACETMGYNPAEVEYIRLAETLGVGSMDLASAERVLLNEADVSLKDSKEIRKSRRVEKLAKYIKPDNACSACYGMLVHALARLEDEGKWSLKCPKIAIGQGYRGKSSVSEIGIGSCTSGFEKSLPGCPPKGGEMLAFLRRTG
ncbi:MAG: DUF362 domain-containing protein [Lachnospiraceae bacterium]|nr:DUF362 domain-containing protein [Lachnospiraceae bacterium]